MAKGSKVTRQKAVKRPVAGKRQEAKREVSRKSARAAASRRPAVRPAKAARRALPAREKAARRAAPERVVARKEQLTRGAKEAVVKAPPKAPVVKEKAPKELSEKKRKKGEKGLLKKGEKSLKKAPEVKAPPAAVGKAAARARQEEAVEIPSKPKGKLKGKEARRRDQEEEAPVRAGREGREKEKKVKAAALREQPRVPALPLPLLTPIRRPSVEERSAQIEQRLAAQSEDFRRRYIDSFDMSWIYHDSALEGVVYTFEELRAALGPNAPPLGDSTLQPTFDDIRRHKEAIEYVRDFATKKRLPVTLDILKKIYLILHPEEGDIKTVKYRKDIPQHRLYFHEYAPPDKIAYKMRQIVDWLNDPETRKTRNGIRIAARAHYDLLRVYPFTTDSGKVARLFMNLLLMRTGLPPSIIHSTERQRYYEALKSSATTVLQMVQESVENALSSVEKLLNEHESRKRAFVS